MMKLIFFFRALKIISFHLKISCRKNCTLVLIIVNLCNFLYINNLHLNVLKLYNRTPYTYDISIERILSRRNLVNLREENGDETGRQNHHPWRALDCPWRFRTRVSILFNPSRPFRKKWRARLVPHLRWGMNLFDW